LVHPRDGASPDLLQALERRSLRLFAGADRCKAMARLCLASREGGPVVLLVDRPALVAQTHEFVAAAHRYVPGLTVWVFDPAARPQLAAYVEPEESEADEVPLAASAVSSRATTPLTRDTRPPRDGGVPSGPMFRSGPKLRLTDDPPVDRGARESGPEASENDAAEGAAVPGGGLSSLLSDEELAMLLADEPGRGQTGRKERP